MLCLIENKVSRLLFTNAVSGSEPPEFNLTLHKFSKSYSIEIFFISCQKQSYLSQVEIDIPFQINVPASSVQIPKIFKIHNPGPTTAGAQMRLCATSSCVNVPGAKWTSHTAEVKSKVAMHQSKEKCHS